MIRKVEMYQAVCDGCGIMINHLFDCKKAAENYAVLMCGWESNGDRLYCVQCAKHYKEMGVL